MSIRVPTMLDAITKPLISLSESISESNGALSLSMLPREILLQIAKLFSVETILTLMSTCKYIRNQLDTWFLLVLASENNTDRATSGFIVDAIRDEDDTCLWRNAKFFIKDHNVPKELSIHLFANTTTEKISSDEVRSMIIQLSGSQVSYEDIHKFLKFLFSKVSFKNLKCLMFCGIELSKKFSQEIGTLNLDVFHIRKFSYHTDLALSDFLHYCNSLKTLYAVHPNEFQPVWPPKELKKLVIYCPKSSKHMIDQDEAPFFGLDIDVNRCHALKEM